jgi:hypothetical protein
MPRIERVGIYLQDMPMPDAPELVALLQTVGFQLCNMGFSGKEKCVGRAPAALKVTIECGASGVVAELRAPAEAPCRCTVFSSKEHQPPQEQASFWTITTSQVFIALFLLAKFNFAIEKTQSIGVGLNVIKWNSFIFFY